MSALDELRQLPKLVVLTHEPMARHTSFCVGGPADILVLPQSVGAVSETVRMASRHGLALHVIGEGTNLLVRDGGLRGITVKIADNLSAARVRGERIEAQAGATLHGLARLAASASLAGLEFGSGIPGTVGGAAVMNAGAFGAQIGSLIAEVQTVEPAGSVRRRRRRELSFGYRDSSLRRSSEIVVGVAVQLRRGERERIEARMDEIHAERKAKQPLSLPSAGSVFRRPENDYAGRLIEGAGLKGARIGGAEVSEKHAGFIVNRGGATAADILSLINHVRDTVAERMGVRLQLEVCVMGEE